MPASPINLFTLKFDSFIYSQQFETDTRLYTKIFLNFFLSLGMTTCLILFVIYTIFERFIEFKTLFSIFSIFIFLFFIFNKCCKEKKLLQELALCLIIFAIFILHTEKILPNFLSRSKNNNSYLREWVLFNAGVGLEIVVIILYLGKIRWGLISIFNFLMNMVAIVKFVFDKDLNIDYRVIFSHTLLISLIIPVFISYLNEKSQKIEFYKLKKMEESLSCFENLIDRIIPNQILLLNTSKKHVIYANKSAMSLFEVTDIAGIQNSLDAIVIETNESNSNLSEIYNCVLQGRLLLKLNEFITYDGSFLKPLSKLEIAKSFQTLTLNFDIKMGMITWKDENVIFVLFNDRTSFFSVQKLKEINEYKDNLLATVSHDLRTPLNTIMGMLELILDQINEKLIRELITTAQKSAKILLFIISDILDFSQISNGKLKLNIEEFYIENIIEDVIEIIKFQAKKKSLLFSYLISDEMKQHKIVADPYRLQQILLNLLSNAVKFTFEGFIMLEVLKNKDQVLFSIRDTGVGIEKANIPHLFTLFSKIKNFNENINRNGIGLGLVISQNIVKLMKSDGITVKSVIGKGSQFEFNLPLVKRSDSQIEIDRVLLDMSESTEFLTMKEKRDSESPIEIKNNLINKIPSFISMKEITKYNPNKQKKILIVDDEIMNIITHSKYLESFGLDYETARNGAEAVQIVKDYARKSEYFSVILMDCNMPVLNGFEATNQIRELIKNKIIKNLHIIAITANCSVHDINDCLQKGMDSFLGKPVSKTKMKERLAEILNFNL